MSSGKRSKTCSLAPKKVKRESDSESESDADSDSASETSDVQVGPYRRFLNKLFTRY